MSFRQTSKFALLITTLLMIGSSSTAYGGSNEGFTVAASPQEIRNVQVGGTVVFIIAVDNITTVSATLVKVKYDPALLAPVTFIEGDLLAGALGSQFFGLVISTDTDGLNIVEGGLTLLLTEPVEATSGNLGRMTFEVLAELPVTGSFVSIIDVTLNGTDSEDTDSVTYQTGEFGISLERRFPNKLFDLSFVRKFDGANFTWLSNLQGIDDKIVVTSDDDPPQVSEFRNPVLDQFNDPSRALDIVTALATRGLSLDSSRGDILEALDDAGIEIPGVLDSGLGDFNEDIETIRNLKLTPRSHLVRVTGLTNGRTFSYSATSNSFAGDGSQPFTGTFQTRATRNTTSLGISSLRHTTIVNPNEGTITLIASWLSNRPADSRILVEGPDAPPGVLIRNTQGTLAHLAVIEGLQPLQEYTLVVSSRVIGADEFIDLGVITEEQALGVKRRDFRTPRLRNRSLRFTARPFVNVSTESATIDIDINVPGEVWIDYGNVADAAVTKTAQLSATDLYSIKESSADPLTQHSITLSDLEPSTRYRFRISAILPDVSSLAADLVSAGKASAILQVVGDTLTTDPRGNQPWSRDLQFVTSAAGDNFPPAIVEGPLLTSLRDRIAVLCVETDVPSIARIYYGTETTFGTPDEIEIVDLNAQGRPRFSLIHYLTMVGLDPGTDYSYRLELEAANDQITTFEPTAEPSGKIARILQPPGGAGSFVTDTKADTQFPVITFGPVNTLNTHDTSVVEWATDESSDSDGRYGADAASLDDFTNSGDNVIDHKLTFTNLDPGTTYSYVIGSTDPIGNGATESTLAVFTTNPELDLTQPKIEDPGPGILSQNDRSATVFWTLDEIGSGEVEFGPTEDLGFIRSVPTTSDEQEITLTNLEPSTTYFYRVTSFDVSNNGPVQSDILQFTTDGEPDITLPVISNLVITPADSSVIITWDTDELADSFVEFGTNAELLEFNIGDANDALLHEITLTNLLPSTSYFGRIGSVDRSGNISESEIPDGFTTLEFGDLTPPQIPANVLSTAGSEQVILVWDASTDADLSGYNIYRRVGEEEFGLIASRILETTYTDLGLTNDTPYDYQITAIDRTLTPNESDPSDLLSVTPIAAGAPAAPVGLTRQGDNVLVPTFVFTNSAPINADGTLTYTIQVSTVSDFSNVTAVVSDLAENAKDVGVGQTGWTIDRDLNEGATYFWRVRAIEGDLIGEFSVAEEFVAAEEVLLPGDFNEDSTVNIFDFFLFVDNFNQTATDDNRAFDLDGSGAIDFFDLFIFVDNFGKSLPGKAASPVVAGLNRTTVIGLETLGGTRSENQLVTVRVWAGPVVDLAAFGFVLNYDEDVVEFLSASKGPGHLLEGKGGSAPLFKVLSDRPGELTIGNGISSGPPVTGQGLLAEITFRLTGSPNDVYFQLKDALVADGDNEVMRVHQLRSSRLLPGSYYLGGNFPNPFNPSTTIEYALPQSGRVTLDVFNVAGQRVRRLVQESQHTAGIYTVEWDGLDHAGRQVGSGVYFYRLEAVDFVQTKKMLLIQ